MLYFSSLNTFKYQATEFYQKNIVSLPIKVSNFLKQLGPIVLRTHYLNRSRLVDRSAFVWNYFLPWINTHLVLK